MRLPAEEGYCSGAVIGWRRVSLCMIGYCCAWEAIVVHGGGGGAVFVHGRLLLCMGGYCCAWEASILLS